jgi:hypothetical protein
MAGNTTTRVLAVTATLLVAAACRAGASTQASPTQAVRSGTPATPSALSLAADSPTDGAAAPPCRTAHLALSFAGGQGAARTVFLTFRLANIGSAGCRLEGFVRMQMLDESSRPLPTRVVSNGGAFSNQPPPSAFTLPSRTAAGLESASTFQVAYSSVQRGREPACPQAYQLLVTPPGEVDALAIPVQGWTLAPCNGGELSVTPLRPPGVAPA